MNPIFIVGVGRSGTSLLQSMLAAHSQVSFLPETAFIRRYIATSKLQRCIKKSSNSVAEDSLKQDSLLERLNFDLPLVGSKHNSDIDYQFYIKLQNLGMKQSKKERFGDKDPRLIEFLPTVHHYFPKGYVVNIVRDPRDVLCSKKKAAWSAGRSTMFYSFANRVQLKMATQLGTKLFGKNYIEIVYEDLIKNPKQVLKTLCAQLELNYEEGLLDFGAQAKKLVSETEKSWKKETYGPLLSDNSDKWKKQLTAEEIALTELSCRGAFNIGNYRTSESSQQLSLMAKFKVYSQYVIILSLTPVYVAYRLCFQKWALK